MHYSKFTILLTALLSTVSNAAIEQISYSDRHNIDHSISLSSKTTFINANNAIEASVSAGLDRKVRLQIESIDGTVLSQSTSGAIGISDRISGTNGDYYGKTLTVNTSVDGQFQLVAQILDVSGSVVQEDSYPIIIDTKPPTLDTEEWLYSSNSWADGSISHTSPSATPNHFGLKGVVDENGVGRARVISELDGTGVLNVSETGSDAHYAIDEENDIVRYLNSVPHESKMFPVVQGRYQLGFRVWDKAGNYSDFTRTTNVETKTDYVHPVKEIFNPNTGNWEQYVSGMEVYANPYQTRYRFLTSEFASNNSYGLGWSFTPTYVEGQYSYYQKNWVYPAGSSYIHVETNSGTESVVLYNSALNVRLASDVEAGPKGKGIALTSDFGDEDWDLGNVLYFTNNNQPFTVPKARFKVEARTYKQKAWLSGLSNASCIIEPNETDCDALNFNYIYPTSGKGYVPYPRYTCKATDGVNCDANSFGSIHESYLYVRWDHNAPEISDINISDSQISFKTFNGDIRGSWDDSYYRLGLIKLILTDLDSGQQTDISQTSYEKIDLQNIIRKFSTTSLPEGRFKIEAYVSDSFNNYDKQLVSASYLKDGTPPQVSFTNYDEPMLNNTGITGLDGVKITIHDALNYEIDSVRLSGGPLDDAVLLATRSLGENTVGLEYPRIFPSLEENQDYTLTVTAHDEQLNSGTSSVVFNYTPPNLKNVGKIFTLPVSKNLLDSTNKPIAKIESENVRTGEGNLINGEQDLVFSLRTDATFAVIIEGETVQPGETKEIKIQATNGSFEVPVYPAVNDVTGVAPFFAEIQVLRAN